MAITKNEGRQEVIAAKVTLTYDTLSSDVAVGEAIMQLPAGAIVVGGFVNVTTAFDSTTSDVLDIGDSVDDDEYTATPVNLQALGVTALTITGYKYTAQTDLLAEWTAGSTGTATAGSADVVVQYIVDGRAAFSEG